MFNLFLHNQPEKFRKDGCLAIAIKQEGTELVLLQFGMKVVIKFRIFLLQYGMKVVIKFRIFQYSCRLSFSHMILAT